jgi:hypothetical protein
MLTSPLRKLVVFQPVFAAALKEFESPMLLYETPGTQ